MDGCDFRQAAEDLLTTDVADKLLDQVLDAASELFVEAGFVRGKLQDYPIGDLEEYRVLNRGFTFRDPANGHVVMVHADLTLGYGRTNLGKFGLRLSVVEPSRAPREPGQGRWHAAEKLAVLTLVESAALHAQTKLDKLCASRLGRWVAMLQGPAAWDFKARIQPVLASYNATVAP